MKYRHWMIAATAAAAIAAASGTAYADVRAGIEQWRAGNYEAAIRARRPPAAPRAVARPAGGGRGGGRRRRERHGVCRRTRRHRAVARRQLRSGDPRMAPARRA